MAHRYQDEGGASLKPLREAIPGRVLIVEDEHMIAFMVEDMIRECGVPDVHHAACLIDALALLDEHEFDFAFLDINLGEENSLPVARRLSKRGIPFVFASGYDMHYDTGGIAAPLLRKPVTMGDIRNALIESMSGYEGRIARIG